MTLIGVAGVAPGTKDGIGFHFFFSLARSYDTNENVGGKDGHVEMVPAWPDWSVPLESSARADSWYHQIVRPRHTESTTLSVSRVMFRVSTLNVARMSLSITQNACLFSLPRFEVPDFNLFEKKGSEIIPNIFFTPKKYHIT